MTILILFFACVVLPNFGNVNARIPLPSTQHEHVQEHGPGEEDVDPFNIPQQSTIQIQKLINHQYAANDVVIGTLVDFSIAQFPSPDHTPGGHVEVFHGTRHVMSARLRLQYPYTYHASNNTASVTYECVIQGDNGIEPAMFVATLQLANPERRWDAGITHIYFVNHENVPYEGEVAEFL